MGSATNKIRFIHAAKYTSPNGEILVVTKCPLCGTYLELGTVEESDVGDLKFSGFICAKHGEVFPIYDRLKIEL